MKTLLTVGLGIVLLFMESVSRPQEFLETRFVKRPTSSWRSSRILN